MSIYNDTSIGYTVPGSSSSREVLDRIVRFRTSALPLNQAWWAEANIDTRIETGDPDAFSMLPAYSGHKGPLVSLNHVRKVPNMLSGIQRQARNSTVVTPVENASQETADQFTKVISWLYRSEDIAETFSDAYHGALITGLNLLQVWIDYRDDPISGDIKVDRCEYNSFMIDPFFRRLDFSDCNGILKRSFVTPEECVSLLPGFKENLYETFGSGIEVDAMFPYMPENINGASHNLLSYDEFYYRAYRDRTLLVNREDSSFREWNGTDDALEEFLSMFPEIEVINDTIPTVNLSIVVQDKVVYDGPNPLNIDVFPFVPVVSYYRPASDDIRNRLQGVVRNLRDPQFLYNLQKTNEHDIVESQINTGIIVKENAVVNFDDVFKKGTGQIMVIKENANIADLQFKDPPNIPQSLFQLSDNTVAQIPQIAGLNEEALGAAIDDKAGVLAMLRQNASLRGVKPLMDKLDTSQKLLGEVLLRTIQKNFTPGKVQRITDEQPTQEFYSKSFGKYGVAIEQGVNTSTQRQNALATALYMRERNIPIPDEFLIENMAIQNKKEIVQKMAQDKQMQSEIQNIQMQSQLEIQSAQIEMYKARAKADLGWTLERTSRVPENRAFAIERLAESEKDRQQAVLNMAKTLSELDNAKLQNLQKLLELTGLLTQQGIPPKIDVNTPSGLEEAMFNKISKDDQELEQQDNAKKTNM